ncbi:MAG: hypothetical protein ABIA74_03525 [bacterium]
MKKKNLKTDLQKDLFVVEELKNAISTFKREKLQKPLRISFGDILPDGKIAEIQVHLPEENIYGSFEPLKITKNFLPDEIKDKSIKKDLSPLMNYLNIPSAFALFAILKIYESSNESLPAEVAYLLAKMNASGYENPEKYLKDVILPVKDLMNSMLIVEIQDDGQAKELKVSDFLIEMNKTYPEILDVDFNVIPQEHEEIDLADLAIGIGSIVFKVITDLPKLETFFMKNENDNELYQSLIRADAELEEEKMAYQKKLQEYEKNADRLRGRIGAHPASTGMLARPYTKKFRTQEAFFKEFAKMYDYKYDQNQPTINEFLKKGLLWFKEQTLPENFELAIEWLKPLTMIGINLDFLSTKDKKGQSNKNIITEKLDAFWGALKGVFKRN